MLSPRNRAVLDFFNRTVVAAASIMLVVHGYEYVSRAIAASPAMQWPMKYYFLAVPVGGLLMGSLASALGSAANRARVSAAYASPPRGTIHAGERWKTVTCAAIDAISGTN